MTDPQQGPEPRSASVRRGRLPLIAGATLLFGSCIPLGIAGYLVKTSLDYRAESIRHEMPDGGAYPDEELALYEHYTELESTTSDAGLATGAAGLACCTSGLVLLGIGGVLRARSRRAAR